MQEDHPAHDLVYLVRDPTGPLPNTPAMTTMLYGVCGNDREKFEDAMRLVGLFMTAAYDKGTQDAKSGG